MDPQGRPTTAESSGRPTSTVRPQSQMSSAISEDVDADRRQSQTSSMPTPSQPPPSRASRKGPPLKNIMARSSMGTGSNATSSRPPSATSRLSRSHVPTISSHAFFRPMSSQQAQRQRGGRPYTGKTTASTQPQDGQSDAGTEPRQSMSTLRQGPYVGDVQSPPSRGTEYTEEMGDRGTSATGHGTVRSLDDSTNLLSNGRQQRPQHLNLGKNLATTEAPAKSPRSFRSGFSLGAKRQSQQADGNHQRLSSAATSPQQSEMKPVDTRTAKTSAGRNYEYFEGNTAFFWNGRLQNSRDRPVNIATGVFLIVPGVLFFVFS